MTRRSSKRHGPRPAERARRTGDTPSAPREATGEVLWPWALLLMALPVIAYLPCLRGGFVWDDDLYVEKNEALRTVEGLLDIWFRPGRRPYPVGSQYYPMAYSSLWVEYHLWGLHTFGYHLVSVLLHGGSAVLLWLALRRLGVKGAWLAGAVLAVHPVCVESVAWITERKNTLSLFLYLGSALAWIGWAGLDRPASTARSPGGSEERPPGRGRSYAFSLVLFVVAVLAKSITASLPAALLLVTWWKWGRIGRREIVSLVPFFVVGISLGLLTLALETQVVGATGEEWSLSAVQRVLLAGRIVWFYAAKLALPTGLCFIYPRWEIDPAAVWSYAFPAGVLVVLAGLWLARGRWGRGPFAAILFFIGTLVPALGFFNVFPMRYSWVADHFQYHASIGLIVLGAAAGVRVLERQRRREPGVALTAGALLLAGLGVLTWRQSHAYQNMEALWVDTLAKNPGAWSAHNNLGMVYLERGELEPAAVHFESALAIRPGYAEAENNLGTVRARQERLPDAAECFRRALAGNPDYFEARMNLANVLTAQGALREAEDQYRALLEKFPANAVLHFNYGDNLQRQLRLGEAKKQYEEALRLKPGWDQPLYRLEVLRQAGFGS